MSRVAAVLLWVGAGLLCGCVPAPLLKSANDRAFDFATDTLAFNNELYWDYIRDDKTGVMRTVRRDPKPEFAQHCYAMSRAARLFFQFARFEPTRPALSDEEYRQRVAAVMASDPRETDAPVRIVIPGYANLRRFSAAKPDLIKGELGSALSSYLQLGNWRMIFPFWKGHREESAKSWMAELQVHRPPIVHLATFPRETINHAVMLYGYEAAEKEVRFKVYDPNSTDKPTLLVYDRARQDFYFPANNYFIGGRVDAYEMYNSIFY